MADTLSTDVKVSLAWLFQDELDLSTVADTARLEYSRSLADGTGADQADKVWHDQRIVAAASDDDLDLTNLTSSIFGSTVTINFAKVKAILLVNTSTTSGDELRVGGAGAGGNAFGAPFNGDQDAVVEAGADSALLLSNKTDGWTVTAGTGDILRINNPTGNAITYQIAIIGTSS